MTVQTFRVVDAFVAVFAAFDDELLPLFLSLGKIDPFRGLGTCFFRRRVGCPERVGTEKEAEKEDEQRKKDGSDLRFHKSPESKKLLHSSKNSKWSQVEGLLTKAVLSYRMIS
jgi:hypothetical protein